MAQANATATSDFSGFLRPEIAAPYFNQAQKVSSVQQLARRVDLGINGESVPVVTTKPTAAWVDEGGQKPATEGALSLKTISPKKIAAISVVSAEVVRANPGNYMNILRDDIAEAFAIAFDNAVLHGTNSPFAADIDDTTKTQALGTTAAGSGGVYADVVKGLSKLVNDGKKLTGFAFDRVAEPVLLGAVDGNGRPLFSEGPGTDPASPITPGRVIGRPSFIGDQVGKPADDIVGYGGDWSQVVWGAVGGISYRVSTEAAVTIGGTLTSLFEHNLVAILAEAEYGVLINDPQAFVKYTYDAGS